MIGVIADAGERDAVREFFELFKTPWEFYLADRPYDVLLCAGNPGNGRLEGTAKLIVLYAGRKLDFDDGQKIRLGHQRTHSCFFSCQGNRIPIYGNTITFPETQGDLLTDESSQQSAAYLHVTNERLVARIGYDIFQEVRTLLTTGQPAANASLPTLELHISFLRDLMIGHGVELVEIPPAPAGHPFLVCLTHDVDHPSIRQHQWDHTLWGFLYRAVFGSVWNFICGRIPLEDLLANWAAALKLPFVYLGFAKDFWRDFDDRYLKLERGLSPTFFAIPFKNDPGKSASGAASSLRGARYGARDIADAIWKLMAAGCEIGLHGIDAWCDSARGREEVEEIRRLTGAAEIGVRMHWLYYNQESPAVLEKVGVAYDSTVGYNETVGYRAGTAQVFKPLATTRLLELPMQVMDTALFYPTYLNLSPRQATVLLAGMLDNAVKLGGVFTVNWHDRSVSPERLWVACYRDLLEDLKNRGAWFATAQQATSWFRKRRAATFEIELIEPGSVRVKVAAEHSDNLPGLRLRVHKTGGFGSQDYVDMPVGARVEATLSSCIGQ